MFEPVPLTCVGVFNKLKSLANVQGNKSTDIKSGIANALLCSAKGSEVKYIIRSLQGRLRIGFSDPSVLAALARVLEFQSPDAESLLRRVYSEVPSWDIVVRSALEHGVAGIEERCCLTPGIPIKAMLARPSRGVDEVLEKFQGDPFTVEFKYDGERVQIHYSEEKGFRLFSRNAESMTEKYPDVVEHLSSFLCNAFRGNNIEKFNEKSRENDTEETIQNANVESIETVNLSSKKRVPSFVLDCEAVAVDRKTGQILPFQTLMTRKRKDVQIEDITVSVCIVCFDCLFFDEKSLLQKPLTERRKILWDNFPTSPSKFVFAKYRDYHPSKTNDFFENYENSNDLKDPSDSSDTKNEDSLSKTNSKISNKNAKNTKNTKNTKTTLSLFLKESIKGHCEGLMAKSLSKSSTYEPSKRSSFWLKLKKDYLESVGDSLDLVPIGGFYGKGKRAGVFGSFLVACYDANAEEFQAVCKIGTGLSEEALAIFSERYKEKNHQLETKPSNYISGGGDTPDVWLQSLEVWEVKCADLSLSPKYLAAAGLAGSEDKGIALRFPRFVRSREDKKPEDATTPQGLAEMYLAQVGV